MLYCEHVDYKITTVMKNYEKLLITSLKNLFFWKVMEKIRLLKITRYCAPTKKPTNLDENMVLHSPLQNSRCNVAFRRQFLPELLRRVFEF